MDSQPSYRLLPLTELTREIGVPYDRFYQLTKKGLLKPYQVAGGNYLFRSDRILDILPALRANLRPNKFLRVAPKVKRAARRLNPTSGIATGGALDNTLAESWPPKAPL